VAGSCEHGNELSGAIEGGLFQGAIASVETEENRNIFISGNRFVSRGLNRVRVSSKSEKHPSLPC
jgi:hypothetical protein